MHRHRTKQEGAQDLLGILNYEETIDRYAEISGNPVRHTPFFKAINAMRMVVIMITFMKSRGMKLTDMPVYGSTAFRRLEELVSL